MKQQLPGGVDEYIAGFPDDVQVRLCAMRDVIRKAAPEAVETISYAMPAYVLNGNLVYFAGYKTHIGLYATPTGHAEFADELARYKQGKGSVQFPHAEALPLELIERIVKFRVAENVQRAKVRKSTGTTSGTGTTTTKNRGVKQRQ